MEVTRSNYEKIIPEIINKLKWASFISIDCEYTGINAPAPYLDKNLFDDGSDRYWKLRESMDPFIISQFGLSLFTKDWDSNTYNIESYNIYVFPVAFDEFGRRSHISLQVSSSNFLAANNFDFNKFIREGCPYLNRPKAAQLKDFLTRNRDFLRSPTDYIDPKYFPERPYTFHDKDIEKTVERLKGFSNVIEAIGRSKKPLIGHNMLIDLMLLYRNFVDELPDNYLLFKLKLSQIFPHIYDTKCLASGLRRVLAEKQLNNDYLRDASLFSLYRGLETVERPHAPKITLEGDVNKYKEALDMGKNVNLIMGEPTFCHEAGFDATVTGCIFIKLQFLVARLTLNYEPHRIAEISQIELMNIIDPYANQVNLGRARIPFINFVGKDPASNKPKVMRVSNRSEIDVKQLRRSIAKFGEVDIEVYNSRTILIATPGYGVYRDVSCRLTDLGYKVTLYEPYQLVWKLFVASSVIGGLALMKYYQFPLNLYRKWF